MEQLRYGVKTKYKYKSDSKKRQKKTIKSLNHLISIYHIFVHMVGINLIFKWICM